MNRTLDSLRECLFSAFANPGYYDPQAPHQLWAIREGLRRIDPHGYGWREVQARKEHDCMRGHTIRPGEVYFHHLVGGGWGSEWKFCAGCVAMILHFREADKLPTQWFTHWDRQAERPVTISEEQ
jgi:hypothetical protein